MDKKMIEKGLYLGTDGCKGGWITAVLDHGELRLEKYADIGMLIDRYPQFDEFLIDMAIGLRDSHEQLRPDDLARKELRPRSSTVFAVPSRSAVYEETEEEQKQSNLRSLGKSLSKQSIAIIPKIRELDLFLSEHPEYKNRLLESHPELCFARLNGQVLLSKKKESEGIKERESILRRYLTNTKLPGLYEKARELRCQPDDLADAICLCIAAALKEQGLCETIPEEPEKDEKGLYMKLTVPKKEVSRLLESATKSNKAIIIENNPIEVRAMQAYKDGEIDKAHELEADFVRWFQESFPDGTDHCSCEEPCRWHGMCRECVAIHRAHGDHLPNCLKEDKVNPWNAER